MSTAPASTTSPAPASERRPDADAARRERAGHAVAQGAKAAGLTAAGFAGGVLLASRHTPPRKLTRFGRRKPPVRAAITKRFS